MNRNRKVFEAGLVRSGKYRPMIEKVFREESIPLDLMYLAQVESLFRPQALSKAKAKGIWQFGKGTAVRYGLKVSRDVDERSDPEKSTRAAARYLNDLYKMFKDWNLVLAAYNWGEGKVQRLINSTGMNDFWQLVDLRRRLPEETRNHVPLIQASVILGRNPEKYGFTTQWDPPLQYTEVSVSKPIDLRSAAKVLSTSIDELKKLNPSLRGMTTPANYPNFQLKVPIDSAPEIHEKLSSLPTAKIRMPQESGCQHKVKAGETLSGIAKKYHVSLDNLRKANGLSAKKSLKAGVKLDVPSCSNNDSMSVAAKSSKTGTKAAKIKQNSSVAKKAKTAKSNIERKKLIRSAKTKRTASPRIVAVAANKAKSKLKTSPEQIATK
jgi:membrane-bound lytic murein transglycosylase D